MLRGGERTVQGGAALHLAAAEDGRDLGERLGVVVRVEEGEAAREEAQEDDAGRPDVERCGGERERERVRKVRISRSDLGKGTTTTRTRTHRRSDPGT